jgi:hypothetical protein
VDRIRFSALASMVIIITLAIYKRHMLISWFLAIFLNTILATLGIALRGLMITIASALGQSRWLWFSNKRHVLLDFWTFDQASRGPRGSLLLLWRLRLRYIPFIGVFVTLPALASDAFIQQSISYPTRRTLQANATSSMPSSKSLLTTSSL